jgi:endonuclease G
MALEAAMSLFNRVRDAERQVRQAALSRWLKRTDVRDRTKAIIAAHGDGAADSPQRNARLNVRQAGLAKLRSLSRAGRLPLGIERKMGATLDYTSFAPSDLARKAGRPVARIVELRGAGVQPEGIASGFLIAPRLLITNHHVFPDDTYAVGTGANFLYERTDRGLEAGVIFEIDPATFFVSDEALDFAIVAVKPKLDDGRTLNDLGLISLIEATPKILKGQY